jgi:hypothetical protein
MGKVDLDKKKVAEIIKDFISGGRGEWDWDDFISIPIKDKYLDSIRERCAGLPEEFPPVKNGEYCNQEGINVLQNYVNVLSE